MELQKQALLNAKEMSSRTRNEITRLVKLANNRTNYPYSIYLASLRAYIWFDENKKGKNSTKSLYLILKMSKKKDKKKKSPYKGPKEKKLLEKKVAK